jgi:hypothetical protein
MQKPGDRAIHEVVVVAEHLDRSAEDVVGTLLHEAAHAANFERGIHDCSRSQYHNQRFRLAAEELGLEVRQVPHYGFAMTRPSEETSARYALEIAGLAEVLMHRNADSRPSAGTASVTRGGNSEVDKDSKDKDTGGRYKKASCTCPLNIRVSRKVMTTTVIRCETCGNSFRFA